MNLILYATKCWGGDIANVFGYHPKPDLVIANNLGFKLVNMGNTKQPYYAPERRAITEADKMGAEYILWYASDVTAPENDWISEAIQLLEKYPIVSPFWEANYGDYVLTAKRESSVNNGGFEETDFGFEDHFFSDQAYIAKVRVMKRINYNIDHPIKQYYPAHGGNSFECRVAQWLASTSQKRAVLRDYRYKHTTRDEK